MGEIITWKEAFTVTKTLKDIREENNLEIPEYYRESTRRWAVSLVIYSILFGLLSGGALVYLVMVIQHG